MGSTQKVEMVECTPCHPIWYILLISFKNVHLVIYFSYTHMYVLIFSNNSGHNIIIKILTSTSKSVYDFREINNLFICNMVTYNARKAICEKVQLDATVRDLHSLNLARDDVMKGKL